MIMRILFTKEQIAKRIKEIAEKISEKYKDKKLTLVGVLRGGAPFLVDLMREINPKIDLEIDFISVGSYGSEKTSSGVVTLYKDLTSDISGRYVIIVDDICDSGRTIEALKKMFDSRGVCCEVACMLDKPSGRVVDISPDYSGFEAPNVFVVGYGMDDNEKYRNLKDICVIE